MKSIIKFFTWDHVFTSYETMGLAEKIFFSHKEGTFYGCFDCIKRDRFRFELIIAFAMFMLAIGVLLVNGVH